MVSDWEKTTLDNVCIKITDGAHKSPKSVEYGKPMASVKDLEFYGLNLETARHISEEDYDDLVKQGCKPELGDVLIAKDGNSALDTVCTFEKDAEVVLLSSVAILRPNPKRITPRFLKYYFLSAQTIDYLKRNFISGAAIPRVVLRDFKKAEILLPPLPEQKAIAHILGSLDDKIELNRQMNETLEAMAQALFKSWFVDFDPVIDNALAAGKPIPDELLERAEQRKAVQHSDTDNQAIRALFPDAFELTDEMGWIPEGWAVKNLTEIADFQNGFAFYTTGYSDSGYKVVDLANISTSGRFIETHRDKHVSSEIYNLAKHEKHHLQINDIVMAMTDITQAMGILGKCGKIYESNKYILNQRIGRIRVKESININFLLTYLNSTYQLNFLKTRVLGTVQKYVNTTHIKEMNFVVPQNAVMNKFGNIVDPIFNKMRIADEENQTLAKLRDTLLPKLLSGELRITEAAAIVDEV